MKLSSFLLVFMDLVSEDRILIFSWVDWLVFLRFWLQLGVEFKAYCQENNYYTWKLNQRGFMLVINNADADCEYFPTRNNERDDMLFEFGDHPIYKALSHIG